LWSIAVNISIFIYIYKSIKKVNIMGTDSKMVLWSSGYSVTVKVINEQRRELIKLVNDMYDHIKNDELPEQDYFKKVIYQAAEKIKKHFETEEKFLLTAKFYDYDEHKNAHDAFLLTFIENILKFEDGKKMSIASFTRFIRNWILNHISIMDKQYHVYFRRIASCHTNVKPNTVSEKIAS